MNKTRRIALYIYLVLAGIGLQFELGSMAEKDVTLEAGRDLVLNLAVLAAFFLPFYFLIKKLAKKLSVETIVLGTALFGGAFISGWLSPVVSSWKRWSVWTSRRPAAARLI